MREATLHLSYSVEVEPSDNLASGVCCQQNGLVGEPKRSNDGGCVGKSATFELGWVDVNLGVDEVDARVARRCLDQKVDDRAADVGLAETRCGDE